MNGERGGNRTCNLLIKSQLLCQLSYAPTLWTDFSILHDHSAGFHNRLLLWRNFWRFF